MRALHCSLKRGTRKQFIRPEAIEGKRSVLTHQVIAGTATPLLLRSWGDASANDCLVFGEIVFFG